MTVRNTNPYTCTLELENETRKKCFTRLISLFLIVQEIS